MPKHLKSTTEKEIQVPKHMKVPTYKYLDYLGRRRDRRKNIQKGRIEGSHVLYFAFEYKYDLNTLRMYTFDVSREL